MFGKKKKQVGSRNSRKQSGTHSFLKEQFITPEMVAQAIQEAELPPSLKEALLSELPNFVEHVDEATNKIFNPSAIWFESLQFADYVAQLASHLREDHGAECREGIAEQLIMMADNYKDLAESAMRVLDKADKGFKHGAQQ